MSDNDRRTAYFGRSGKGKTSLRESLAALEHRQWQSWTEYLVEKYDIPEELADKWKKNWVPYEELSEKEKDKDRKWADKAIRIMNEEVREPVNSICAVKGCSERGSMVVDFEEKFEPVKKFRVCHEHKKLDLAIKDNLGKFYSVIKLDHIEKLAEEGEVKPPVGPLD